MGTISLLLEGPNGSRKGRIGPAGDVQPHAKLAMRTRAQARIVHAGSLLKAAMPCKTA